MSKIAQQLDFCTLEKTAIGKLLDNTKITTVWDVLKHLWNMLSEEFVKLYIEEAKMEKANTGKKKRVHVYFRTVDDVSVLLRQEVKIIEDDKGENIDTRWHPIYNNRSNMSDLMNGCSEIGRGPEYLAINIVKTNHGITDKQEAFRALQEKLRSVSPISNKKSIESCKSTLCDPNRAPFATDNRKGYRDGN